MLRLPLNTSYVDMDIMHTTTHTLHEVTHLTQNQTLYNCNYNYKHKRQEEKQEVGHCVVSGHGCNELGLPDVTGSVSGMKLLAVVAAVEVVVANVSR